MKTVARVVGVAIVVTLLAAGLMAGDGKYKPPFVPMMPGARALADGIKANLNKPNLKQAGGDSLFAADLGSESMMGASNYATCMGNGRLSACISPWGELTMLRWPHVTHSDQLRYFTQSNSPVALKAKPVRMVDPKDPDWKRYGRVVEPIPDSASQGIIIKKLGPDASIGYSFSSESWKSERSFDPDSSAILLTTLTQPDLKVEISDWIDPEKDVFWRNFVITGEAEEFCYKANFAPWAAKPGDYSKSDPADVGFAAGFLGAEQAMIAFKPVSPDRKRLDSIKQPSAEQIDQAYPKGGTYIVWGFAGRTDRAEAHLINPSHYLIAEIYDPDSSRGLSFTDKNHDYYIFTTLDFYDVIEPPDKKVSLIISLGSTAADATAKFRAAKAEGAEASRQRAIAHWQSVSARVHLPETNDPITTRVIRRSVLNLIQGQDKETGAIVASLARQPQYHFDWPRDGSFYDLSLDLAGFREKTTHHHEFYRKTQFRGKIEWSGARLFNFRSPIYDPSGHWPSNMAADGSYGSIPEMLPHEIDETALLVWDFWRHERTIPESERAAYRESMRETLELAADALFREVDFRQAWTKPNVEDDNFPPDATLHGVAAVLTGLAGACDAGPRFGVDAAKVKDWCEAAKVLRGGVVGRIDDPKILEAAGWRGISWTLWPAPVFDDYSEPGAMLLKEKLAASIRRKMDKNNPGFAYLGEDLFILALADRNQQEYRDLISSGLKLMTHEVAFPGTDCFGEVTVWGDFARTGERIAQQRTSIPHLWSGITVYLTALALHEPQAFDGQRPPAP